MYTKMLVPLDGSPLAESVLPHVGLIAQGCGAKTITFLRVVEPAIYFGDERYDVRWKSLEQIDEGNRIAAQTYLADIARKVQYAGIQIETVVVTGKPAETIADYAEKNGFQLIVIATHGRSGLSRWVWGSVADRVLRSARVPVLMVRPHGGAHGV